MISSDTTAVANENVGKWIEGHLQNSSEWHLPGLHVHLPHFEPINVFGMQIDLSITNHVVMLWIAGLIVFLLFKLTYNTKKKVQTGFGALLEMLVIFVRDEIAIANMGEK